MSPKAWKASFSEFHRSYSPKTGQRFSFKSPDKPRHGTLSRESSTLAVSPQSPSRDLDTESNHSEIHSSAAQDDTAEETAGNQLKPDEDSSQVEEEKDRKEEESEPKPPAESDNKRGAEKAPPSESSSELNNSCDSESLELQLSAADNGLLHIEEREDSPVTLDIPKPNGLENGEVSGFNSEAQELSVPHKVCHLIGTQLKRGDAGLLYALFCVMTPFFFFSFLQFFLSSLCPIFRMLLQKNRTQKAQWFKVLTL